MSVQEQIDDLQMRFAHQELVLETLHDTVVRQDRVIAELRTELQQVRTLLREIKPSPVDGNAIDEPLPPHY